MPSTLHSAPTTALRPLAPGLIQPGPLPGTAIALLQPTPDTAVALHPEEERLLDALPAGQRPDFVAGRLAAARALAALGTEGPVLRAGRRPLFPTGVRGSISHCTGHIGVCIASTNPAVAATGIDLERTDRLSRGAARLVCTPREREWIARARRPESRLSVLFSAKEAIYKALSGLSPRDPVFHDVELRVSHGELTVGLPAGLLPDRHRLTGWVQLLSGGYVLTSVAVLTEALSDALPEALPETLAPAVTEAATRTGTEQAKDAARGSGSFAALIETEEFIPTRPTSFDVA
ncbi:4'-phosphopantetheinyl transferase [Streptomyces sp. NPDC056682]|uniref:4'-phosphopantetheinyl transferase family protein n=1 Tax=Streptomyces sp. NPDC056682 TaxID=3345909 RepID=UPI0036C20637